MKKSLFALTLFGCYNINAQILFNVGGTGMDYGKDMVIDNYKNIIVAGYFYNTVDFDPSPSTAIKSSNGYADNFIVKYDSLGNFKWVISFGSSLGIDIPHSVDVDKNGNIVAAGYFSNSCDFDPGTNSAIRTSNGGRDAYIAKYDSAGSFLWVVTYGADSLDDAFNLNIDSLENIYWTGVIEGSVTIGGQTHTTQNEDLIFGKISPSGEILWSKQIGGAGVDEGSAVMIDKNGTMLLMGYFQQTIDADPGIGQYNLISSGSSDTFFGKYDSSGNFIWAKRIGGPGSDIGAPGGMGIDKANNLYFSGNSFANCDFDPGSSTAIFTNKGNADWFVAKYDQNGNYILAWTVGGSEQDQAHRLCVDDDFNVFVTGWFRNSADFNPNGSPINLTGKCTGGGHDGYIAKYNSNGICLWAKQFGGNVNGADQLTLGTSVKLFGIDKIIFTGRFHGNNAFTNVTATPIINSLGSSDIFVASLFNNGNFITDIGEEKSIAQEFTLYQNYPNPFNPTTTILFTIRDAGNVRLKVYNLLGEVIETMIDNEWREAGSHSEVFSIDSKFSSGIYFYQLQSGDLIQTKRMVILK